MKPSILGLFALALLSSFNSFADDSNAPRAYLDPTIEEPVVADNSMDLEQARAKEASCMKIEKTDDKVDCLDIVSDWWFHSGGDYVTYNPYSEMTRIMRIQLSLDPKLFDVMSNLAFYTFSIEVDAIMNHDQNDFTDAPMKAFNDYESVNSNEFTFYYLGLDTALPILAEKANIGSVEVKKAYYAENKRRLAKAKALWATTDKSKMDPEAVKSIEFNLNVADKMVKKFINFDTPAAPAAPAA